MDSQVNINYKRIAEALEFIKTNFKDQPSLEVIAANLNLSHFHFQKIFSEWAGTSPKNFLQYVSINHAKKLLRENNSTLFDTAIETGLSGTSRLHDLFIKIEGMTPADFKNGGKSLLINYSFAETTFGSVILASTEKGICYISFIEDKEAGLELMKNYFNHATFILKLDFLQENALTFFNSDWKNLNLLKLHLKGTNFQIKVWEALLKIPMGNLSTYGTIAEAIQNPKASRAVGTAIGSNPVAFLIPCHRVIQNSGIFGGYMWGNTRKTAMIGWECAQSALV